MNATARRNPSMSIESSGWKGVAIIGHTPRSGAGHADDDASRRDAGRNASRRDAGRSAVINIAIFARDPEFAEIAKSISSRST